MARNPHFSDIRTVSAQTAASWQDGSIPVHGEGKKGAACYTVDGSVFWSYSTCVAVVDHDSRSIVLNVTKYSQTTNRWMWMLQNALIDQNLGYTVYHVMPEGFNVTASDLVHLVDLRENGIKGTTAGDPAENILGSDDVSMRKVWVSSYTYQGRNIVHRKRNKSTLI